MGADHPPQLLVQPRMIQQDPLQPRPHPLRIQRLRAHRRVRVQGPRRRSDNYRFAVTGIPAHILSTFNLRTDYHRPLDESRFADGYDVTAVIEAAARAVHLLSTGPRHEWKPEGTAVAPSRPSLPDLGLRLCEIFHKVPRGYRRPTLVLQL